MGIYLAQKKHISAPPRRRVPRSRPGSREVPEHAIQFGKDVRAAGKTRQLVHLLYDYTMFGLDMNFITRAENIFHGHRDLLVAFNRYLPRDFQCTVPPPAAAAAAAEEELENPNSK